MRKRRRSSRRLDTNKKNRTSIEKKERSQLQQDRLALGTAKAYRDRLLQHKHEADSTLPRQLQQMLQSVNKDIKCLQLKVPKAQVADV